MDLSVCVVSWNTRDLLDQCVRSIYETTEGVEFEVIVVDNASSDGTAAMLHARHPQVRLLANTENAGFARANNQAIEASTGRYVMLLNPDTLVHSGLQHAVSFLDRHPDAAVVGCKAKNADGSVQVSWNRWYPSLFGELMGRRIERLSGRLSAERAADRVFPTGWVGGVCMTVRRSAFEQVGLLDEGYFMYTEEADWCRRFRNAGWLVMHSPGVVITHYGGQSADQVKASMRIELARSKIRFIAKFRSEREAALYRCFLSGTAAAREAAAGILLAITRDRSRFEDPVRACREFRKGISGARAGSVNANG